MHHLGRLRSLVLGLLLSLCVPWIAAAQNVIDITGGKIEPLPIAISEFFGETPAALELGRKMADVVSADLESSGLFRPVDRRAFIQSPEELQTVPRFADWRQINAQTLVTGTVGRRC